MKKLIGWFHSRQRAVDIQILWPACRQQAPNLNLARSAFICHAFNSPAWLALGQDEVYRRIEALR